MEWLPINHPRLNDKYECNEQGQFRNAITKKILTPTLQKRNGYLHLGTCVYGIPKTYRAHRLIALTWIPNPDNKPFVNHINGNKTDIRAENLEWTTAQENCHHYYTVLGGVCPLRGMNQGLSGDNHMCAKTIHQYSVDGMHIATYGSVVSAGKATGVSPYAIRKAAQNRSKSSGGFIWKYTS